MRTIGSTVFTAKNPMLWMAVLVCPLAISQQTVPSLLTPVVQSASRQSPEAKDLSFDVVSIRKNNGNDTPWGFYPDSYKAIGMPLWRTISYAYFPMRFHDRKWIKDAPSWIFDENYDLIAKVPPGDEEAWQKLKKLTPAADNPELQAMFQKVLEDRCRLKVHRTPIEIEGYALMATSRLKLTPGKTDHSSHPDTIMDVDGGKMVPFEKEGSHGWEFHNVSIATLLSFLSIFSGTPIQDKTNLEGRYDFTLEVPDDQSESAAAQSNPLNDFMSVQSSLQGLGLKLDHTKVWINAVVVDHIEKPTEN